MQESKHRWHPFPRWKLGLLLLTASVALSACVIVEKDGYREPNTRNELGGPCDFSAECEAVPDGVGEAQCIRSVCKRVLPSQGEGKPCPGSLELTIYNCAQADDLYCDPETRLCRRSAKEGDDCHPPNRCATDLYCDNSATNGISSWTCKALSLPGEPCQQQEYTSTCIQDNYCDQQLLVCIHLQQKGEPCTTFFDCDPQLYCNDNGTCQDLPTRLYARPSSSS
jgi:hypothetical protein